MTLRDRLVKWFKRTGSEVLGWILIPVGIVMMPAPGPGMLVLVAGVALLAPHYAWARRARDFLKDRAIEGAQYGVATIPRIVVSALGGLWLLLLGIVWWASPEIPEFDVLGVGFGPQLPAAGWGDGARPDRLGVRRVGPARVQRQALAPVTPGAPGRFIRVRPGGPVMPRALSLVLSTVVAVLAATLAPAPAQASDDLLTQARRIVAGVADGSTLRVVVTSVGSDGVPRYRTTVASSRADALGLVRAALGDGLTVSMAQPVTTLATRDPLRSRQWALDRLGAERAWTVTRGGRTRSTAQTVVAVVDTGVMTSHPDLRANLLPGRDVLAPGTSPDDANGHGTHVAGIVAAVAGNGRGVAGLAPRTKVLPVRVLDANGSGATDQVARGVVWAVQKGADVVNLSLGSSQSDPALRTAVKYAVDRGVVVVAAAGNDGGSLACFLGCPTQYPAAYPGVVGVGSVDRSLARSSFSSTGSWVDVAAPGGDIWSTTTPRNRLGGSCTGQSYCAISGTSMATPYVAAAAALALSKHPRWGAAGVVRRIASTSRDLGPSGRDSSYGAGLLDVNRLLRSR
ncbi:MAG: S8 family serine peptidase [Aeromicrobium erythreum]